MNRQQQARKNSHIYASFAGAGSPRNTNGILSEAPTMWWDEERIGATVSRQFVLSKLRPDEQLRLDEPVRFGDGLTDDTYMEWIEQKAKRIFLILVDLSVPDQIFGVIDDSWDDDDLPVPLDQVERLRLTYDRDEKLERRFFHRQFIYLLRNIQKGEQVYYDDEEVVPLELAEKRPVGAVLMQTNVDKVHLPGRPDDVFLQQRIPLGVLPDQMPQEEFLSGIEAMKVIEHDHLTSLWATYIHQGCGYLLLTPVNDSTLKSFLNVTPQSVKILAKQYRRVVLLNWLHCLADALSFLHGKGLAHRSIKPSNIMLDVDNQIFLGDCGVFHTSNINGEKQGFDKEAYDYSAPEQSQRPPTGPPILPPVSSPGTPRRPPGSSSALQVSTSSHSGDSFSIYTSSTASHGSHSNSQLKLNGISSSKHDPQKADIFSLGAIFLEILTFFLKRTSRNFASHRSCKNKTSSRGGGLPDSSFHKNLGQVESWMNTLAKDASKKEDKVFRGVSHILSLIKRMVSSNPDERPTAAYVQERMFLILTQNCGIGQGQGVKDGGRGRVHCETRKEDNEWNFGFEDLRLASQRAAAEACASVAPVSPDSEKIMSLGNGGVIYGIERKESFPVTGPTTSHGNDGDRLSINTKTSKSSEGKSKTGSGSLSSGGKVKPKAKAWQAPVYAGMFPLFPVVCFGLNWNDRRADFT